MKIPFVDLKAQYKTIKSEIDYAIVNTISNEKFIGGDEVEKFEKSFSNLIGAKYCISCANGTDALYVSLKSLNLKPGDEVITTSHSWISTSEAITQAGGKVVFCDTELDSFLIDPKKIENKITSKTVGIIPVHLYGQSANMTQIVEISKKHKLWVIEDCAQAHLAKHKDLIVGNFGKLSTFSFYPGKNLGAYGDAGCIVTNDKNLAEWCKLFANHGGKGQHYFEGINSRMDGLQAAILNVKLPYLSEWTKRRQKIASLYMNKLSGIRNMQLPSVSKFNEHVYHLFVIKTKFRNELRNFMNEKQISTGIHYSKSLPNYKAYNYLNIKNNDFPNSSFNENQILSIPIYPELNLDQIDYICENLISFFKKINDEKL